MRDSIAQHGASQLLEPKTVDTVVIGNGPSGIATSFMLSGFTPYYCPQGPIPDEDLLHMRLRWQDSKIPLTEMNLQELSDELEGRAQNPVALLVDQLCHPYADAGSRLPSQIEWRNEPDRAVDHVVIGKASKPGGVWQSIEGDMKTLSKANWMQLFSVPFQEINLDKACEDIPVSCAKGILNQEGRASMSDARDYYERYVQETGIAGNFLNGAIVTSVEKVSQSTLDVDGDTGEAEELQSAFLWEVKGEQLKCEAEPHFCIRARNVVLAIGTSDVPNQLRVKGEELPFVAHSVSNLESHLNDLEPDSDPVLVVGAGLSASDAILAARKKNLNVIHVFRETPCGNPAMMLRKLPRSIYPEYVNMYELMCGEKVEDWYVPYPHYSIDSFLDNQKVMIRDENGNSDIREVSLVLVQIGSSPDLSFVSSNGSNLGIVQGMAINSQHNPIAINPYTHECIADVGLYAVGPLAGDNFVRFVKGGAFAAASHILSKKTSISSR